MNPEFLALLACPRCPKRPALYELGGELVCTECDYRYAIVDGIPHLLPEEAMPPKTTQTPNP